MYLVDTGFISLEFKLTLKTHTQTIRKEVSTTRNYVCMHKVSFDIIWKSVPYSSMNRRLSTLKGVVVFYEEGIVLVAFWSMRRKLCLFEFEF